MKDEILTKLNELPSPYKEKAIKNYADKPIKVRTEMPNPITLIWALRAAFEWIKSPEGYDYWLQLDNLLQQDEIHRNKMIELIAGDPMDDCEPHKMD